jgi:hypothetical protein
MKMFGHLGCLQTLLRRLRHLSKNICLFRSPRVTEATFFLIF